MIDRYARQRCLEGIGECGQRRLGAARLLVVGAGGLGSPALQYLAGAGIGSLRVVDPDRVALHNLHRQVIYRGHDCDRPKAEAAREALLGLNDSIEVEAHALALDPANVEALLAGCALALDCADNLAASYTLSDACAARGIALISASALGWSGYVGGFCGGGPSLRALFPAPPARAQRCEEAGVIGPAVGTLGVLQAQFALCALLERQPSPIGRLLRFDAAALRFAELRFEHAAEPARRFAFLARSQLREADRLIELRDAAEAPTAARADAERCAPERLEALAPTAAGRRTVFCCHSGLRAWRAAEQLAPRWPGELALLAASSTPSPD